jgi:hypothetical protein
VDIDHRISTEITATPVGFIFREIEYDASYVIEDAFLHGDQSSSGRDKDATRSMAVVGDPAGKPGQSCTYHHAYSTRPLK